MTGDDGTAHIASHRSRRGSYLTSMCALLLLLCWLAGPATPAAASTGSPPQAADTTLAPLDTLAGLDTLAAPDSLAADTMPIVVLSDSARRVLDSVAVAALADTLVVPTRPAAVRVPVLLAGRTIFQVYSGLGPFSPEERAARLSERLEALARSNLDLDSLRVLDGMDFTTIQYADRIFMSITDQDAQALQMSRREAALYYLDRVRAETEKLRDRSTLRGVLVNAALTLLLLALLVALLKGLARLFRWLDTRVDQVGTARLRSVTVGKVEVLSADRILRTTRGLVQSVRLLVALLLIYAFLTTAFGLFPWTQAWSSLLLHYLIAPIRALGHTIAAAAPNLLAIAVIVVIIRWFIKVSNFFFVQLAEGHVTLPGFYPEFAEPTRKIVRFLLIVLAIMLIYPYTPVAESRVFQGLTVFLGILFSLGSSTAVANIVAGIVLTYTRSFQIGDRIRVAETTGDVIEKTFLVTRLRTPKNEDIAIPNSTMLSAQITNYSTLARSGDGLILHTTVTIGYDVPWPRVHEMLRTAGLRTEGVEPQPEPFVLQTALGDFSVAYQLNVYTRLPGSMPRILSGLHQHIQDVFAEAGIEILSPVYEAHRDGSVAALPPSALAAADDLPGGDAS